MRRLLGLSTFGVAALMASRCPRRRPPRCRWARRPKARWPASPSSTRSPPRPPACSSVAVQGTSDLSLQLVDEDGQVMPDGSTDRDLNGNEGTELLSVTLTEPGAYRVRVRVGRRAAARSRSPGRS